MYIFWNSVRDKKQNCRLQKFGWCMDCPDYSQVEKSTYCKTAAYFVEFMVLPQQVKLQDD